MDRTAQLTTPALDRGIAYDPPSVRAAGTGTAAPTGAGARRSLHVRAAQVLEDNWTGSSTVPSRSLYPHQWSWDSAFIAIGLRHLSPLRAQTELETLLAAQWGDGRIPHIVFNPSVPLDAYFPSPDFWRSSTAGRAAGAPRTVQTSGIVQPPVHALAAWLVHLADPGLSRARGFLAGAYPRLAAWHRYLLHRRDLGGGGLASVVHPWEQGMDNSPCWDAPLARVTPAPARSFRRADLDHGAAEDRPTDLDYGRYVRLAADYRDAGYADRTRDFAVEDPAFNALLIASEHALARIAAELGATGTARHTRAERLTAALVDRLWDPEREIFLCRDLRGGEGDESGKGGKGGGRDRGGRLIPERGVSGLVPLLLPELPREIAAALVRTLDGPHFGTGTRLVPSYDLLGEAFDPHRYWRGPAWFNTGWLLERGLREHGEVDRADALAEAVVRTADASEFAEYVDPFTGAACGATGFGWTAALALDLHHRQSATPREAPHNERQNLDKS
ncbi:MGH1-like glycoside hydrolase domain-containing protein [Streptomyces fuscichromogenes]|uniref:Mannosylglycerate hydrolase MGH1-like glycoside hydrolase domain-containing protein n=1 Tax=Streptomyces fuscichromogenes TaxID=1324013 RepID=A0A917UJM7_9ACTN|nr:hypothetical protein [Streptomyces fuscichromogenes]GGM94047.1 hypothetical protein GCM10011578_012880 [Streptomyces fuscichromogenes]